jgi:hypothetical protein
VWNNRDSNDETTQSYTRLVKLASNNHPAESRMVSVDPLLNSPLFPNVSCYSYKYRQPLDLEGLIGRAQSVSYLPQEGEAQQQLVSGLKEIYERDRDKHGLVYLTYHTSVYLAQPKVRNGA